MLSVLRAGSVTHRATFWSTESGIEPIADQLPTDPNAHVIFIPQGSLFYIPFPALKTPTGQYLIEKHTILTAPSIQVLELTHKHRERVSGLTNEVLVVGNKLENKDVN